MVWRARTVREGRGWGLSAGKGLASWGKEGPQAKTAYSPIDSMIQNVFAIHHEIFSLPFSTLIYKRETIIPILSIPTFRTENQNTRNNLCSIYAQLIGKGRNNFPKAMITRPTFLHHLGPDPLPLWLTGSFPSRLITSTIVEALYLFYGIR